MQFVPNGPEIPEALLEAHEEGRVVFFCGAGISYPAKLPTFYGLVEQVYKILSVDKSNAESEALKTYKYDTTLGLLEQRLAKGRVRVRKAIAQSLIHDLTAKKATQTHEALLTLSKNRHGATRLITTNFDRVFEDVIENKKLSTNTFSAPLLPVPKNRWDGLIYLHGLLDGTNSEENFNSLVATSGDFGLAYLVERWAARFVSELFRNYTVCFVGYSINDPILRYMMDALAADSMMGEKTPVAYAFGNTKKGKEESTASEWAAKNVVPILYHNHSNHYYLHETLHTWANSYRDGVNGKQAIVTRYAHTKPTGTTKQDNFVRQMLWAISDETGLPARRFAEASPSPSIEWLQVFADNRFGIEDLSRFDVSRNEKKFAYSGDQLKFSLLSRPSPSSLAPRMSLAGMDGQGESKWDKVMEELAKWLANHITQPEAIFWVIGQGGNLHPQFKLHLEKSLEKSLEKDGDSLSDPMKKLWVLVLFGYAKYRHYNGGLYSWMDRFKKYGNTPIVRLELKAALRPSLRISRPYSSKLRSTDSTPQRLSNIANIEITLASDHVHSAYDDIKEIEGFNEFMPDILTDMTELLCETLDLMCEVEKSSELDDYSYIQLPSISDHDQNKDHNDWTLLVTLCRDAWVATSNTDPDTAIAILTLWARSKYPVFRRLVFFALAHKPNLVPVETSLPWLLSDGGHWIWSISTMRETMRLLVSIGSLLSENEGLNLQRVIIDGPPRSRFSDNTREEEFRQLADRMRWLRLKKLHSGGASATEETVKVIEEIEQANTDWDLAPDERDEFPTWSSNGEGIVIQQSPKNIKELILWLRANPTSDNIRSPDNWSKRCRDDFRRSISALLKLAKDGEWLSQRWGQALYAWSNDGLIGRSWECAAPVVAVMPVIQFTEALHAITFWVSQNSSNIRVHQEPFFSLIDRIIELGSGEERLPDNVSINHPIGRAANSLLNWWFSTKPEDGQGLPDKISNRFNQMCTSDNPNLSLGSVVLAQQIIPLFRVDPDWTKQNLLTDFSWGDDDNKTATMWDSFLHNPRIYPPLLKELKEPFLSVPDHIHELSNVCAAQYARYLTYISLNEASVFSDSELKATFSKLTSINLETVVKALFDATAGAGDQKTEYVKNRVLPFVKKFWPNAEDARTEKTSLDFAQICAISEDAFDTVFEELEKHLSTVSSLSYLLPLLEKSELADSYPALVLRLLDRTIPVEVLYLDGALGRLLTSISQRDPELEANRGFIRLNILSQQHGE